MKQLTPASLAALTGRGKTVPAVLFTNDGAKKYVWPVYVANLRARIRCPVCLLVITAQDAVARWAGRPIELGGGNRFVPWVLGPSGVPEITDERQAQADPELAVFSAMAHGRDADVGKAVRIASIAQGVSLRLDAERSMLYFDLVQDSLSEAAQRALRAMDPAKYEYRSEFAKRYFGQGKAEGKAEGRLEVVLRLLTLRYGVLPQSARTQLEAADSARLDAIAARILQAQTLDEALSSD